MPIHLARAAATLLCACAAAGCAADGRERASENDSALYSVDVTAGTRDFSHDDEGPVDSRGVELRAQLGDCGCAAVVGVSFATAHVQSSPASGAARTAVDTTEV